MSTPTIGFLLHPREVESGAVEPAERAVRAAGLTPWTCPLDPGLSLADRSADLRLLVTIGGDGTFLLGARLAAPLGVPVLGVNRGQLGFLTDTELDDLPAALGAFLAGRYTTLRRSLLELSVVDPDSAAPRLEALALNEVVVRSTGTNIARVRIEVDDELLGEFDADGVVVATATGSTAYALSSGGPPVDPRVRATVIVPLAPHAVITRAVVVPEAVTVHIRVLRGRTFVAADGALDMPLAEGARVAVSPGPELQVVQVVGAPRFLSRLREKLRFGTPLKETFDPSDGHQLNAPREVG